MKNVIQKMDSRLNSVCENSIVKISDNHESIIFYLKVVFIVFLLTLLCHAGAYTNIYLGHDMSIFWNKNIAWDIATGRYFGFLPRMLHGFLQVPWMVGCISSLFMAMSVIGLLKIFRIKTLSIAIIIGLCFATWPSYIAAHGYLYMLTQFSFALLTSVWAIYYLGLFTNIVCKKEINNPELKKTEDREKGTYKTIARISKILGTALLSVTLMVLSIANYQAYIGIAVGLILINILYQCCTTEKASRIIRYTVNGGLLIILSVFLYYFLWLLLARTSNIELASYREMNMPMGEMIASMVSTIGIVYNDVFQWFISPNWPSYFPFGIKCGIMILFVAEIIYILWHINNKRRSGNINNQKREIATRILLVVLSVCLIPFAMNISQFLSHGQKLNSVLMDCAYILPLIFLIIIINQKKDTEKISNIWRKIEKVFALMLCIAVVANGFYGANASYLKQQFAYYSSENELSQALARLSSEEEYELSVPVAVVLEDNPYTNYDGFEWCKDLNEITDSALSYEGALYSQLRQMRPGINLVGADEYIDRDEVKQLQPYPANNCLAWLDGVIVIKILR